MKANDGAREPQPRLLGRGALREIVIVVSSILIAFALDAWWDGLVERRELRDQLGGVVVELEAGRAELEEAAASHRLHGRVASALLQRLGDVAARDEVTVPDTLVGALFSHFTMDVVTTTTRAFLDAGGGTMFDSHEEREALAAWPAKMLDAIDDQAQLRLMVQDGYHAYMVSTFSLGNAIPAGSDMIIRGLRAEFGLDVPDFRSPPSSVALRPTPQLLNHLVWRKTAERTRQRQMERLLTEQEALLASLRSMLGS